MTNDNARECKNCQQVEKQLGVPVNCTECSGGISTRYGEMREEVARVATEALSTAAYAVHSTDDKFNAMIQRKVDDLQQQLDAERAKLHNESVIFNELQKKFWNSQCRVVMLEQVCQKFIDINDDITGKSRPVPLFDYLSNGKYTTDDLVACFKEMRQALQANAADWLAGVKAEAVREERERIRQALTTSYNSKRDNPGFAFVIYEQRILDEILEDAP